MENSKIEAAIWSFVTCSGLSLDAWRLVFTDQIMKKFLMCPLIKTLGRAFVSKHAAEPLNRSVELLKHSGELLRV